MKNLIFILLLVPFFSNAHFLISGNSSVCKTFGALELVEESRLRRLIDFESLKIINDCDQVPKQTIEFIIPHGTYSKARMINYENKYKIYYINNRDLVPTESNP